MPRERHFSESEVVDRLTDAFCTHGYASTSLALLQDATGLGKQSLYNTFGDKQAMYLQAIACAVQRGAGVTAAMQAAANGRAALGEFVAAVLDNCASPDPALNTCIVTSGLLEGVEDTALTAALTARWQATHEMLRATVERGQRDGSIASPVPTADLAELLMAVISGLRVTARAGRSRAQMERLVALSLAVLDQP